MSDLAVSERAISRSTSENHLLTSQRAKRREIGSGFLEIVMIMMVVTRDAAERHGYPREMGEFQTARPPLCWPLYCCPGKVATCLHSDPSPAEQGEGI
jgi:hypothetical protein